MKKEGDVKIFHFTVIIFIFASMLIQPLLILLLCNCIQSTSLF